MEGSMPCKTARRAGGLERPRRKCCNGFTTRLRWATRGNTNCRIACGRWQSAAIVEEGAWRGNEQEWSEPHAQAFGAEPSAADLQELQARSRGDEEVPR